MEDLASLSSQEAVAAVAAASSSSRWRFVVGVSAVVLPAAVRVMSNWRGLHRSLLMMQLNHHLRKVQRKRAKLALQGIPPRPVSEEFEALESLFRMIPLTTDIQATRSLMRGFPVFTKAERFLEENFGIPHYFPPLSVRSHVPATWVHPLPESSEKHATKFQRVILYLHGGGYVAGRAADYTHIVARLGRLTSSRMLLVDYCLAPENILPPDTGRFAPVEEAVSAYQWLISSGERPEHITICGDSAGGGLSLLTALRLKELGLPLPRAVVMFSPWLDLSLSRPSWKMNKKDDFLLGVAEPVVGKSKEPLQALITGSRDPVVWSSPTYSPMFALDFSGLPAMYAQVGGSEVLLDEARVVCETAKRQNVDATLRVAPGMCHIFPLFADWVPEGKMALDDAAAWLDTKYATVESKKIGNTLKASLAGTFAKAKSPAVM